MENSTFASGFNSIIITHLTRMKTLLYSTPDCEELELDSQDVLCQSSGDFDPIDENDGRWS